MICEYFNKITAGKIWDLWQGSTCSENTPSVAALRGYPGVHGKRLRNDRAQKQHRYHQYKGLNRK